MARPIDSSLKYFPLDVDFFDDPKLLMIEEQFGVKGSYIATRLLCWIYREGYYINWNNDMALIFARRVGNGLLHTNVNDVVNALVLRSFFNKVLFERCAILTSTGIQKRWMRIIQDSKRKAQINPDYDLINSINSGMSELPPDETTGEQELTTTEAEVSTQRIEKNRIEKNSKVKNNTNTGPPDCKFLSYEFKNTWEEWVKHRSEIHHTLKPQAVKKQVEFLETFSEQTAIEILNQSIKNGWQGLFPPKINSNGAKFNKSEQRQSEWKHFNE